MEAKTVVDAVATLHVSEASDPTEDELSAALWKLVDVDRAAAAIVCRRLQHYRRNEQHLESELGKAALRRLLNDSYAPDRVWRLLRRLEAIRDKADQIPEGLQTAVAACLYAFFEDDTDEEREADEAWRRIQPKEEDRACVLLRVVQLAGA